MTVDEVQKNLSEAKIPDRWKTSIYNGYCGGWETVVLFAPTSWFDRYGERALTSLYRYTGFKNDVTALVSEKYVGPTITGYKITIYLE
jgi:hypothetical protein